MKISFVIPSRNNLKYVKNAYQSIRDNIVEQHEVVLLDDASTDGTWDWMNQVKQSDTNVIIYRNEGPERIGHTCLYDIGAELATSEIFSIFHADMVATPNYVNNLVKHVKPKTVVCATRIEPPLHPGGPEKHIGYFGTEPEEFKKDDFIKFVTEKETVDKDKVTSGVFAPWAMRREDFLTIGGHDKKLFAPMELEDSDIFNRFLLAGYEMKQSWDSLCYHFTCRGSRFKEGVEIEKVIDLPDGTKWYKPKDSEEYTKLRQIKFREWWRKWGTNVLHDNMMLPIVGKKYDIAFVVKGVTDIRVLQILEPWCDKIYTDNEILNNTYIKDEQPISKYDVSNRVKNISNDIKHGVILEFNQNDFGNTFQESMKLIQDLSFILTDSGEVGEAELGIFKIKISDLTSYEKDYIVFKE